MTRRPIEVFFYGLFMDVELLRSQAVVPMHARLTGALACPIPLDKGGLGRRWSAPIRH